MVFYSARVNSAHQRQYPKATTHAQVTPCQAPDKKVSGKCN